jgi:hypothetical protein
MRAVGGKSCGDWRKGRRRLPSPRTPATRATRPSQLAKRYNEQGPARMVNRQHTTSWRAPRMLSAEQQEELRQALAGRRRLDERQARPTRAGAARLGLLAAAQAPPASATPAARLGRSGAAGRVQKKLRPLLRAVATAFPVA